MRGLSDTILPWAALAVLAAGQGFVPAPKNVKTLLSEKFPGAEISYKETSICETTEGVRSFSGYVTLPKALLDDTEGWDEGVAAHLFFWYFESRNNPETAPTSIRIGGGPGASSFDFTPNFPCQINPDSNSTTLSEFSWNQNSNLLYIDQPIGTGFSYTTLLNGTMDLITSVFTAVEDGGTIDESQLNLTTVRATLDQNLQERQFVNFALIPRTTLSAARTLWKFAQVWFNEFPERRTTNEQINLWTVSYGGFYGPFFFSHFLDQNELITAGQSPLANATPLQLGILGLAEPCIDSLATAISYPDFARNNTYGIKLYPEETFVEQMGRVEAPETGCLALIEKCHALAREGDPLGAGLNDTVNAACATASGLCFGDIQAVISKFSTRAPFDITFDELVRPHEEKVAFLNQRWVQEDLGVPLNFTASSNVIVETFFGVTGDPMIRDLSALASVLARGVNVVIASGDRDYRCNWFGAENVTLSLDFPAASAFRAAGYAALRTNASHTGGLVRQQGGLAFARVFAAGHGVSAYQGETVLRLYERALARRDAATGEVALADRPDYATAGPADVRAVANEAPPPALSTCWLYAAPISCTPAQLAALRDGSADVENFVVVSPQGTRGRWLDGPGVGAEPAPAPVSDACPSKRRRAAA
ncbi:Alpha/Beta hydrolase protein [Durotheca rogersii]|uniref:Alpha/Beta hydrolase protein n=1 Tax=Durotheca rogersii TaxID=419775 RepID=UPI00221E9D5C|nr:Alpha/Beta hydrolase protein [Durotheca rogersii]KAI5861544.1 Alpha/Beta hydrolase protein [Durotheca rogersii]